MNAALARSFDELEPGSALETRGRTLTETDLISFAALTGDWHPQHSDSVWASDSPFGERIAHGMLVLSYAVGLLPLDPDYVVALRSLEQVKFKRPARIGDTIAARAEIVSLKPLNPESGLVGLSLRVRDQERRLLALSRLEAIWRRDPTAAPPAAPADELACVREGRVLI